MNDRLFLRGKIWWCWLYDEAGRRSQHTTKCTDREAARAVLRRLEREATGAKGGKKSFVALEDILHDLEKWSEAHSSVKNAEYIATKCKPLRAIFGANMNVQHLRRVDLSGYIDTRLAETYGKIVKAKISRLTVKKEIAVLYQAIARSNRAGTTEINIDALRVEFAAPYVPQKRWLSRDEFARLLDQVEPHRRAWLLVAVYTGARKSEVESLTWNDVQGDSLHIRGTKTDKSDRFVPLHPKLKAALGDPATGVLTPPWPNVGRDLKVACKQLKIDPATPNDIRRTYASWLLQAGVTNSVVAELLGHTTTALVDMTYGKLSRQALSQAVALI